MTSTIHLAGGCFWGLEKALQGIPGVESTECGYANGDPHFIPDYMLVCSGRFGYREAVRVGYDPEAVSLEDLLHCFLYLIDPTQERRQGNDIGLQYQTGVYCWSPAEEYHQRYLDKNPGGYCHIPTWKMEALRAILDRRDG